MVPVGALRGRHVHRLGWRGEIYAYTQWLTYLIDHFLKPWGYVLNGQVSWEGEESDDQGVIHVKDNRVQAIQSQVVAPEPEWA